MTTPHAKTAEEVADKIIQDWCEGGLELTYDPNYPIEQQGRHYKEMRSAIAAAIREAVEAERHAIFSVANEQGIFAIKDGDGDKWKFAAFADNVLDDAGNVRREAKITVRPRSEYHEDHGPVAWWANDFCEFHEEPYIGSPLDLGWAESYQWWSELPDFGPMVKANEAAQGAKHE